MDIFEKRMRALLAAALPGTDVTHLSPGEFCVWQRVGRRTLPTVYLRDLVVVVDGDLLSDIQIATETDFQSRIGPRLARNLFRALNGYDPQSKNPNPFVVSLADTPQDQLARTAPLTVAAVTNTRGAMLQPAMTH